MRILLADDHKIVREGLKALLEKQKDMILVGEVSNGRDAVSMTQKLLPDIVVMDIAMPDLNGIDATLQIMKLDPPPRVLALSMHADRHFVSKMFEAGASGYLLKDCAFDELVTALRVVEKKQIYLSHKISSVVISDYLEQLSRNSPGTKTLLTDREREVLQLLSEGWSTKEISGIIKVSIKTAESHRQNLMRKLGVRGIAELTKFAIREGLTTL